MLAIGGQFQASDHCGQQELNPIGHSGLQCKTRDYQLPPPEDEGAEVFSLWVGAAWGWGL